MIKVYFFTLLLLLFGCHAGHNEKMTLLLHEKKIVADSFKFYQNELKRCSKACKQLEKNPADSVQLKACSDSCYDVMISKQIFELRLNDINFSIDSLSKIK